MTEKPAIAVIGAGLMGAGIALVFAAAGHRVALFDAIEGARAPALARIRDNLVAIGLDPDAASAVSLHGQLAAAVAGADFVIEAAPEDLALKQALFVEIEEAAKPGAILASNTSVIPITSIMEKLRNKRRALGTHWWNPPYLVPLVEVIRTVDTSDATIETTLALLSSVGKTAVEVKKDIPGFIGNRLQHALWREAIALVAEAAAAEALGASVGGDASSVVVTDLQIAYLSLGRVGPVVTSTRVLSTGPDGHGSAVVELRDTGADDRLMTVVNAVGAPADPGPGARS